MTFSSMTMTKMTTRKTMSDEGYIAGSVLRKLEPEVREQIKELAEEIVATEDLLEQLEESSMIQDYKKASKYKKKLSKKMRGLVPHGERIECNGYVLTHSAGGKVPKFNQKFLESDDVSMHMLEEIDDLDAFHGEKLVKKVGNDNLLPALEERFPGVFDALKDREAIELVEKTTRLTARRGRLK